MKLTRRLAVNEPVRFAVLAPSGLSSNSWRAWVHNETVYVSCRDNFREVKVSLHPSPIRGRGRWRVGFTTEAADKIGRLLPTGKNRAWDVWDEPSPQLPNVTVAFKLLFPTPELVVPPENRPHKVWKDNLFIEAAPPGKLVVVTVFITNGAQNLMHASEPCATIARLPINEQRVAQLVAHGDPEDGLMRLINRTVAQTVSQTRSKGVAVPETGYGYFLGKSNDGCRFIFGARMKR
jgi:hypothetical protein